MSNVLKILLLFILIQAVILSLPVIAGESSTEALSTIDLTEANLLDTLRALARKAGLNLVVGGGAELAGKRVTLHFDKIPPLEAMDYILRAQGLSWEKKDKVILVSTLSKDLNPSAYKSEVVVINLKFLSAQKTTQVLGKIWPQIVSLPGDRANLLILKGKSSDILEAGRLIESIDKPSPQILIESQIVEVSESGMEELGIKWGREQGKFKFLVDKDTGKAQPVEDLFVTLDALVTQGKANVLANPRIATVDNREAIINIGSKIPYAVPVQNSGSTTTWAVQYIDAGVSLRITPQVGEGGIITTHIHPEVSTVSEWRTTAAGEFPVISTRNAEATIRVRDGETIVVGGLISEADRENLSKIPILGDLPLLGVAFQNKTIERTKTEIVFLITPHII